MQYPSPSEYPSPTSYPGQPSGSGGPLTAAGSLTGGATVAATAGGALTASGGLTGAATVTRTGGGTLDAAGALTGAATVVSGLQFGGGPLAAASDLAGGGAVTRTGSGSLAGVSTLTGVGRVARPIGGLLAGGGKFEIALTTHHDLETSTPAHAVAWLTQFRDAEVTIGQNDAREARVTISLYDQVAGLLDSGRNDYLYRLFIRYHGVPAIWAPVKSEWDSDGTVTLIAKDVDRLENHYLRDGDTATGVPITADHIGLRLLRDAADNTPDQNARFVAPLGITDGTNTADLNTATVTFAHGDQVWGSQQQLASMSGAPDFELEPYDLADVAAAAFGWYMKLNTYGSQGVDRTTGPDAVAFHCGYGLNNLTAMRAVPDGFITHAHALGDGGSPRATAFHAESSRRRGVYVHWAATRFHDFEALALPAVADSYIREYGLPAHEWTIVLRPDALQQWVALAGYGIGDTIIAGVKKGYMNREEQVRIVALRLRQQDRMKHTIAEMSVVPALVNPIDIGTTED